MAALRAATRDRPPRLLGLLDDAGTRATFFVVGWQAERTPALVREVARHGHEIACHGYSHRFVYRLTPAEFREELRRSRGTSRRSWASPSSAFGPRSSRSPPDALWALDVLVEEGFLYDSSIFPVWNYRYGMPGAARQPGPVTTPAGAALFEVPLSTVRFPAARLPVGLNVPVSGGAYFRLYPYRLTRAWSGASSATGDRLVFYAHPWEYDPEHPRIRLPHPVSQVTHYVNLDSMTARTRRLLGDFRFVPIREAFAAEIAAAIAPDRGRRRRARLRAHAGGRLLHPAAPRPAPRRAAGRDRDRRRAGRAPGGARAALLEH